MVIDYLEATGVSVLADIWEEVSRSHLISGEFGREELFSRVVMPK